MDSRAIFPVLLILSLATSGCVSTGGSGRPDELVVRNSREFPVDVQVVVRDAAGAEVASETFRVAARGQEARPIGQLEGAHVVHVTMGEAVHEQGIRLEPMRDYVNVAVMPSGLGVNVLHGD